MVYDFVDMVYDFEDMVYDFEDMVYDFVTTTPPAPVSEIQQHTLIV